MIVEFYYGTRPDGKRLILRKSDIGVKIRKVGYDAVYNEAIDVEDAPYFYTETLDPIDVMEAP